jgi:tetratricopeptide (TPR) repeat protein
MSKCRVIQLRRAARNAETLDRAGLTLARQGEPSRSVVFHRAAVAGCPTNARYAYNLASALLACGHAEEAARYAEQALRLDPCFIEAWRLKGNIFLDHLDLPDEALESFRRTIELEPAHIAGYQSVALCLLNGGGSAEAIRRMRCTLAARPNALPRANPLDLTRGVALALGETGRYHEAIALLHEIVRQAPEDYASLRRLGELYSGLHDMRTAEIWLERALTLNRRDRDVLLANLLHWARLGDFERSRKLYRSTACGSTVQEWLNDPATLWAGQNCHGKTLRLIASDIYCGDALQFVRFARLGKAAGATVIVEGPRRLRSLLRAVAGVDNVMAFGGSLPRYDYAAAAFWLLFALTVPIEEMVGETPYIQAPAGLRAEWRQRIASVSGMNVPGMNIGIAWKGSAYRNRDPYGRRSMRLHDLRPLAGIPGITLYSLQSGAGREELARANPPFTAVDLAPDFPNAAAAISALDLVVTIDTSIAHLAGALGKPVYVLLPYDACFRWMLDRDDTPWYRGMRLFRQTEPGEWSGPVAAVATAILKLRTERATH